MSMAPSEVRCSYCRGKWPTSTSFPSLTVRVSSLMQRLDAWLHKSYASSAELAAVERSIQATQTAEAISTQINLAVVQTMEARGGQASSVPTATPALENACVKYGIKITEPAVGYSAVNGQVILEGTFSERP